MLLNFSDINTVLCRSVGAGERSARLKWSCQWPRARLQTPAYGGFSS